MKKSVYLGIIALATMSLASCSIDDTIMSVPDAEAIEFGTYLGRGVTTRGAVTTGTNDNPLSQFGVFAFYTGQTAWKDYTKAEPNFMYNQAVNYSNGAYGYTPKKYWPTTEDDKITFFAYAPMAATTNGITVSNEVATGTPEVTYTIDTDNLENMADFVADALIDQTKDGDGKTLDKADREVKFTLNHELTRVNIKAILSDNVKDYGKDDYSKTKVNITDIKFYGAGFATEGTYTFADENDVESPATTKRGSWVITPISAQANAVSIFDTDETSATFINKVQGASLGNAKYTKYGVAVDKSSAVTNLFIADQYLFLIPPTEGGIAADGGVTMLVEYDIVTVDASLADGLSVTPATKVIPLPASVLAQGVAYNFVLTFGLNEVKLSATVADWGNETDNPHNVDWPKADPNN